MIRTFRAALPTDAAAITTLVRKAYAKWVPALGREPMPMTADYAKALQTHDFWLAFDGAEMVGLIETLRQPDHVWVENLCVSPECQGKGLGHALLSRAEANAQAAGFAKLRLLTNELFASNVAFYQCYGFQIERREPFLGGFTIYMSKLV